MLDGCKMKVQVLMVVAERDAFWRHGGALV
jgi:hypothetical protein